MAEVSYDSLDGAMTKLGRMTSLRALSATLTFPPELEHGFDVETALVRARELRFTLWLGFVLYQLTNFTDIGLVPDLQFRGVMFRLLLAPFIFLACIYIPTMPSLARERMLALYVTLSTVLLTLIAGQSTSVQAPYALATVSLAVIYANTAHPLRFKFACLNTAVAILAVAYAIHGFGAIDTKLGFVLNLQSVCGGLFSLVASYRLERSTRLNYLLARKERLHIDDLAREREILSTLSQTDRLTGLANRVRLERWSEAVFGNSARLGLPVGLLMIDIDYFKGYNDHYGHGAGDVCLGTIARVIAGVPQRRDDLAVRYGGEEFVVIMTDVTATQAIDAARRMQAAVAELQLDHANRRDGGAVVTISVGVAHAIARPGSRIRDVIDAADGALYAAKRNGRNRIELACEPALLAAS